MYNQTIVLPVWVRFSQKKIVEFEEGIVTLILFIMSILSNIYGIRETG